MKMPEIAEAPALNSEFTPTEAYALYREILSSRESDFDPRVGKRILQRGGNVAAYQYLDMLERRALLIEKFSRSMLGFDAFLMPTLPFTAPTIASVEKDDDYLRINAQIVRNTCGSFENGVGNVLQRACWLKAEKSSLPATRKRTVRMVSKRAYPRALRLAA